MSGNNPTQNLGEMSTVGSACRHWMQGTEHRLEQLMILCGLRNVSNNYDARKMALPHA